MDRDQAIKVMAHAICREKCAFMGEPPCFEVGEGLSPHCDDPGCHAEASAAYDSLAPLINARVTELLEANNRYLQEARDARAPAIARPLEEWHEGHGFVTWWKFPVDEPSWIGSPLCCDWPGYHTHWTPHPKIPLNQAEVVREGQKEVRDASA